ncbi:MAG: hypothetical protein AB2653_16860 [Candidatus Thiodiazotropha endolucinida]
MTEKVKLLNSREVQDVLNLIDDGFLFERFGQEFLSARLGYRFLASGEHKQTQKHKQDTHSKGGK